MTTAQSALMYQLTRTQDFMDAINSICEARVDRSYQAMAAYIDRGDLNGAAISRGEARAWGDVVRILEQVAKHAKPDNS